LCDVLETLGQLNKTFQIPTYHPRDVHRKVDEVIKALKNRYLQREIRWGPYASECIAEIGHHTIIVDETEVQKQTEERKRLEKDVGNFVQAVVDNLTARFPHSEIIRAAKIFNPKSVPSSDADCVAYGESDLLFLTRQYSSFVNHNQCGTL